MTYRKRTTCRLCDSTQLLNALHYPATPLADEYLREAVEQPVYPLDLYLCEECGAVQLLDIVSADTIYPEYTYETGANPGLAAHFKQYADDVLERVKPQAGSVVVDIGSNDGTLLKYFLSRGLKPIGIDPAQHIAKIANQRGIPTLPYWFNADTARIISHRVGQVSLIAANNVYANIDDLRGFAETVRNLLADDGVFVFETFYLADLIDNMVFDFIYHEHLTAFSLAPLVGFFQRLGMQLFDVQRVATKGGSIRVYVQLDGGKRPVSGDIRKMVDDEWERWPGTIFQLAEFRIFQRRIEQAKTKLGEWLSTHRVVGETIAGYGASPTSTTLIYSFGLGSYLDYLIDDWPGKQGTFSPGLHLPVYAPSRLNDTIINPPGDPGYVTLEQYPDYCVILAWRYAEQIMARNPQYRGTWIVPLPELRIIRSSSLAMGSGTPPLKLTNA